MTSKNYDEAVEQATVLLHYGTDVTTEHFVAVGYRAALQDAVQALHEAGKVVRGDAESVRLFAIARDKLAARARDSEARASELKV